MTLRGWAYLFHRRALGLACILSCTFSSPAWSDETISFSRDIAPILAKQCQTCHGPDKAKGKYRLDTFARLTKPGSSDAAPIVNGHPENSEIYKRLIAGDEDDRMPQKADALPKPQIALVRQWIAQGASFDGPDVAAPLSSLSPLPTQPLPPKEYPAPVPIAALAFSADGTALASSGYHEVSLWNPRTGEPIARITNMPERILGLAYSPDGKRLAVAGGTPGSQGEVRLVTLSSPPAVKLLERIADVMTVVRFSPDGLTLAAGGADNAIRIYDVASGKRERLIEQHADWITDLAYSPDGDRIASASRDKSSRVFDSKTGAMEAAFVDSEEALHAVAWSDDGKQIFNSGRDHKIHAWNAADSKKPFDISLGNAEVFHLVTIPGGLIACASDGSVRSYSQKDRTLARTFGKFSDCAYGIAVSDGGKLIAAGSYDGSIKVWNLEDGSVVNSFIAAPGFQKEPLSH